MSWFKVLDKTLKKKGTVAGKTLAEVIAKDGSMVTDDDVLACMDNGTPLVLLGEGEQLVDAAQHVGGEQKEAAVVCENSNLATVKQKLESIKQKRLERCSLKTEEPQKKKKKDTYRVWFGWVRGNEAGEFKYVMPRQGGGAKKFDVPRGASYTDILDIARTLYQIDEADNQYLGSYKGEPYDKDITCEELVKMSQFMTTPRVYLATLRNICSTSVEDCSTESLDASSPVKGENPDRRRSLSPPKLTPQKPVGDGSSATCSTSTSSALSDETSEATTKCISLSDVENYVMAELAEETADKSDANLSGQLATVDNKLFTPMYVKNAAVQYFVDMQNESGTPVKIVDSGWGPFALIKNSDLNKFFTVRGKLNVEDILQMSPPLMYFLGLYEKDLTINCISKNVVQISADAHEGFLKWLQELKDRLGKESE